MEPRSDAPPPEPTAQLLSELSRALDAATFVRLTLNKPRRGAPDGDRPTRATARRVEIRGAPMLSVVLHHPTKDVTRNHPVEEAAAQAAELLRERFEEAHLFTTEADIELRTNRRGKTRLHRGKPTAAADAEPQPHDRPKRYLLDPAEAPYLKELGIVDGSGRVRDRKQGKFRQLQNFLLLFEQAIGRSDLVGKERLRVVDIGSGKAYLTFALHDFCNRSLGVPTEVLGIDRNEELVATCNGVAQTLGLEGLRFERSAAGDRPLGAADVVVALHACDTATDDALFAGLAAGASVIVAVPCCQKELRPQFQAPPEEAALFRHDTFKDRYTQMLTDSVRSLLLESEGYTSQVIEFISDSHTHRNVMILAVRGGKGGDRGARKGEAEALMARYGIGEQRLVSLLAGREGA